ncbi:3-hydroxyisobutyrate dehydrogenase [Pseudomonas aeruginosa PA38182]|nr:3-hydroxyisobutyrate dehydrogenase [Pseudomonas aeruginosa PA38182]
MTDIAFLGLGNMGGPMAANLLKAGHRVNVFDLQPKAVLSLVEQGAQGADSALQCCEGAEVVISMLPAGQHVESLYLGDDGLLARVAGKPLLIDCSTIAPETARKVAEAAAAKGLTLLDAPVSGGVGGARAGTLSFIVGGPAEGFARPGRSSRTWAGTSSTPAITAPARWRRSATTCSSASSWPAPPRPWRWG